MTSHPRTAPPAPVQPELTGRRRGATARLALGPALALLLATTAALAQYKVVGPDGRVTYTDLPVAATGARVQPMRRDGAVAGSVAGNTSGNAPGTPLPVELRGLVARFPVTLYTSSDCAPCAAGRNLLTERGIPYAERSVASDDDIAALQRLTAGRSVPALTVGGQALRGFQDADWHSTLDLAGYPRESRLPRNWQAPPPTPLVARASAAPAATNSSTAGGPVTINIAPGAGTAPGPAATTANTSAGIRF